MLQKDAQGRQVGVRTYFFRSFERVDDFTEHIKKEIGPWPRKLRFFRPGHPSYEVVLYAFFTDKGPLFQIGTILALQIKIIFLNLFFLGNLKNGNGTEINSRKKEFRQTLTNYDWYPEAFVVNENYCA